MPRVKLTRLDIEIKGDKRLVGAVQAALAPEKTFTGRRRCKVSQRRGKTGNLILTFSSDDLTALKATMNTNLRLLASTLRTISLVSKGQPVIQGSGKPQ